MNTLSSAKPWYKELWFWLLVSPMLTLVVSVPVMLTTAFKGADDRVLDNYYKEGRMINHRFEEHALAVQLGVTGVLAFDWTVGELWFTAEKPLTSNNLDLYFSHPANANKDFSLTLKQVSPNRYRADLDGMERGRWYISLQGTVNHEGVESHWRIPSDVNLANVDASNRTSKELIATTH